MLYDTVGVVAILTTLRRTMHGLAKQFLNFGEMVIIHFLRSNISRTEILLSGFVSKRQRTFGPDQVLDVK